MLKRLCILLSVYGILVLNNIRFIQANDINYSDGNYSMGAQVTLEETGAPKQPCNPSPCGPNSLCKVINEVAVCSCQPGTIGNPPACRAECVVNKECRLQQACVNNKCVDPCVGACGINAECKIVNHNPICRCRPQQTGDPFIRCVPTTESLKQPCIPSPCGPNSICRVVNEVAVCSCLPGNIGSPPACRKECVINNECHLQQACVHNKCVDPCPDHAMTTCGLNTKCQVVNHILHCSCKSGHIGDPYLRCVPITEPCGPLKTTISEQDDCFIDGASTICPNSSEPLSRIVKKCQFPYNNNGEENVTYVCSSSEWIPSYELCQPDCGQTTSGNKYPWIVGIYDSNNKSICSGTIISPYHVVIAGQHINIFDRETINIEELTVVTGTYHTNLSSKQFSRQTRKARKIFIQSEFDLYGPKIALIEVDKEFEFFDDLRPVCMDWDLFYEYDDHGVVVVFPHYEDNECEASPIQFRSRDLCPNIYEYFSKEVDCAQYITGKPTCFDDSGAGLFVLSNQRFFLNGITSIFSTNTTDFVLYRRISRYLKWLKPRMTDNKRILPNFKTFIKNLDNTCILPKHPQYGKFSFVTENLYKEKKRVSSPTPIILSCYGNQTNFRCLDGKWHPSIEEATCKKPAPCGPLKEKISEEEHCYIQGEQTNCQGSFEYGTLITKKCQFSYSQNDQENVTYVCGLQSTWEPSYDLCQPDCGKPTSNYKYPWFVNIYDSGERPVCPGTIISPYHLVTAAECLNDVIDDNDYQNYTIITGTHYINYHRKGNMPQIRKIEKIIKPEDSLPTSDRDIVLIEVNKEFEFFDDVQPVCIDWKSMHEEGNFKYNDEGVIVGLKYAQDEIVPCEAADIRIWDKSKCSTYISNNAGKRLSEKHKVCGEYITEKEECGNYIGAGLFFKSNRERYFIRGIKFDSNPSLEKIFLYANISNYLQWLKFHMEKHERIFLKMSDFYVDNSTQGCILPEHGQYGRFTLTEERIYSEGTRVPSQTGITFTCNEDENKVMPQYSYCKYNEWRPFTDRNVCKQAGSCPSLMVSKSENATCTLGDKPIDCENPPRDTTADVKCNAFHAGHQPIYKCVNGIWDPPFVPCSLECGIKQVGATTLIISGTQARINEYPWVIAVYNEDTHICGGTLISRHFVLSAAHCFTNEVGVHEQKNIFTIIAGKYFRNISKVDTGSQVAKIKFLHIHENYKGPSSQFRDDIALIEVDREFSVTFEVQPACIDWGDNYDDIDLTVSRTGVVAGWGFTNATGNPSIVLKKLNVTFHPKDECMKNFPEDFSQQFLTKDKICGGNPDNRTSLCRGDSGGGLYYKSDGRHYFLRGIVSLTRILPKNGCDTYHFSLFTRVSKYLDWIGKRTRRIL